MNEVWFIHRKERLEKKLYQALTYQSVSEPLLKVMQYSLLEVKGKRLRPLLVYAACHCFGIDINKADPIACAIELIHTYSLIHDDLPMMDNDDLRRGKPTCHKKYNEVSALLAGDALQCLAFEVLSDASLFMHAALSDAQRIFLIKTLSHAAGYAGMAGGQMIDISSTERQLSSVELLTMHQNKTGKLIEAALSMAAYCLTDITKYELDALSTYAVAIGLAFQIKDDILDVITSTEVLGKKQGADQKMGKVTFASSLGIDQSEKYIDGLYHKAIDALSIFGDNAIYLKIIAHYIIRRSY